MTTSDHQANDAEPDVPPSVEEEQADEGTPPERLPALLEALLFVADGPVMPATLAKVFGLHRRQIEGPLDELSETLQGRGLRLQRGPDGVQLVTAPVASRYVEEFLGLESAKRLSTAALETLAIVAYRQPVTRAQVEAIRGVNSDGAIDTLRSRGLVDITGRADSAGRPALFATTQRFLEHFGLERAEDLPALPEEIAGVAAARLMEHGAQLPLPTIEETEPPQEPQRANVVGEHERSAAGTEPDGAARPAPGPHLPGAGVSLPGSGVAGRGPGGFGAAPRSPGGAGSGPGGGRSGFGGPPRGPGGLPPGSGAPRLG